VLPAHQFADLDQQRNAASLGMWLFLATEVMVFGAIFTGYAAYRYQYPAAFAEASNRLNLLIGGVNTLVLLTSSLTMALAVRAARMGRNGAAAGFLIATILLGALFLGFKAVEYLIDYRERLMPDFAFNPADWSSRHVDPRQVQLFLCFYYFLTLLHGLHMIIGLGLLAVLVVMARRNTFSPEHYAPVEVCGLYWHFVDLVWIFLLPLLYLIGTRTSLWG
jgi:cytochrome c oxidase subunit 3